MATLTHPDLENENTSKAEIDESVLKSIPAEAKVLEVKRSSTSAWSSGTRIVVELQTGEQRSYFMKCTTGEIGKAMLEAEFHSLEALYYYVPTAIPRPIAWGQLAQSSIESYFLLLEFVELSTDMVDPVSFCELLATLHTTSKSPNGKFGFDMDTFQGPNRQTTQWEGDWCAYFTRLINDFFITEININGPDEEFQKTFETLKNEVIPLLLRPLQSEGRSIVPCLIHGDLWEENAGTDLATGKPIIFDPAVHYAHNELELGMWRRDVIKFGKPYFRQYLKNVPPSEPADQWDDRNRLYALKYSLSHSMAWPTSADATRELLLRDMKFLIDKYLSSGETTDF